MAHHARPIETLALDFQSLVRDIERLFWTNDDTLDPEERAIIIRLHRKLKKLSHMNAMDALINHLGRLDVDDDVTAYSNRLAAGVNLHITKLDDHREPPQKIVAFPGKPQVTG